MKAQEILGFFGGMAAAVIVTSWLNMYIWWLFALIAGIAAWVLVYKFAVRNLNP
jgi:ABC-type enterobactin transport system permease subunit